MYMHKMQQPNFFKYCIWCSVQFGGDYKSAGKCSWFKRRFINIKKEWGHFLCFYFRKNKRPYIPTCKIECRHHHPPSGSALVMYIRVFICIATKAWMPVCENSPAPRPHPKPQNSCVGTKLCITSCKGEVKIGETGPDGCQRCTCMKKGLNIFLFR